MNNTAKILLDDLEIKGEYPYEESWGRVKDGYLEGRITFDEWKGYWEKRKKEEKEKPIIMLPCDDRLISEVAFDVGNVLKDKQSIFFRPDSKEVLEVCMIEDEKKEKRYLGFSNIKPERFVCKIEEYLIPVVERITKYGPVVKNKSMSSSTANIILSSPQLQNQLPKINRIFQSPIPIIYDGELTFPNKGYDKRFRSYMPFDVPQINTNLSLEEAKEIIKNIYSEFCFQNNQDYINAVSALLTPYCRGLFSKFCVRTPLYIYEGNRERVGKDYCAAITGLIHEGHSLEEPPLSSGERGAGNNEELRKKLMGFLQSGRRRVHFSNNRGFINNAVLEAFLTSPQHSDRILGRNEVATLDNETDISISGNVGFTLTPDLLNRSRFIRLFLDIEDANSRKFETPNLHSWILDNRSEILSALFTIIKNWFDAGKPKGSIPFSSFPEWAEIVGGIMEASGFGNPCTPDKNNLSIGGDAETREMKLLFEFCYEKYPNNWITLNQIKFLINNNSEGIFGYYNFDNRSDQTKFGLKFTKFIGRILSDIRLSVDDENQRGSRQKFMFSKIKAEFNKSLIGGNYE